VIVWSPSGSKVVEVVATPFDIVTTPPLGAPVRGLPFSVKVTVPTVAIGLLVTVAVKAIAAPNAAVGVAEDVTVVVVGCPVAAVIVIHQPPVAPAFSPGPFPSWKKRLHAPCAAAPLNAVSNVLEPAGAAYT
jgi:hypothetical protein